MYARMPSRKVSGPSQSSIMRITCSPFWYEIRSNAALAALTSGMVCWIGCVVGCASTAIASSRSAWARGHICQDGLKWSVALVSIQVAKPSFSQMLSHQPMVTRSPDHWCAISCATSMKMVSRVRGPLVCGSNSSASSIKVMSPQFSMAPAW